MIGYYGYTMIFSYLNVISSMIGIYWALQDNIKFAIICLMVSGICDMLDGPIARTKKNRTERERCYGIQIDSLADTISFGILPVVIGYASGLKEIYHFVIMALYILAALIRLAYFNATEIELQHENTRRTHYLGLPVTCAAVIIPLAYSVCKFFKIQPHHVTTMYGVLLILLSIAFLAKFKLPKIKFRYLVVLCVLAIPVTYFIATL